MDSVKNRDKDKRENIYLQALEEGFRRYKMSSYERYVEDRLKFITKE